MSKAQVNAKLNMDTSPVQKSLDKVNSRFKKLGSEMSATARRMGAQVSAALGAALAAGIAAAIDNGIDQKGLEQQVNAVFTAVFGGAGKAAEAMKLLSDEAKQNPIFSASEMNEVGRSFANYVGGSLSSLKDAVESSQFLSALSGKPILDTAEAIKGALRGEMDSLGNFLSPEAMKRLEKGKVTIQRIREEIDKAGGNQDLLNQQNSGLGGTKGNLKKQFTDISKGLVDQMAPYLSEKAAAFTDWLQTNKAQIIMVIEFITKFLLRFVQAIVNIMAAVYKGVDYVTIFLSTIIAEIAANFSIANVMKWIGSVLGLIPAAIISIVTTVMSYIVQALSTLGKWIVTSMATSAPKLIIFIMEMIQKAFPKLFDWIGGNKALDLFKKTTQTMEQGIAKPFDAISKTAAKVDDATYDEARGIAGKAFGMGKDGAVTKGWDAVAAQGKQDIAKHDALQKKAAERQQTANVVVTVNGHNMHGMSIAQGGVS